MPRDFGRINRILGKVMTYWARHPDLRLGQLIVNVTCTSDPFYVEDDLLERRLDAQLGLRPEPYMERSKRGGKDLGAEE